MLDDNQLLDVMFPETIAPPDIVPELKPVYFKLSLDPVHFSRKEEAKKDLGGISGRLADQKNQVIKDLAGLGEAIKNGRTWSSCFDGRGQKTKANFKSSQIIALDVDNSDREKYLSLVDALKLFSNAGININAWYYSFSHTSELERFRLIIQLAEPINTVESFENLVKALMRFCPQVDESCKNADRLFFGSNNFTLLNDQPNAYEAIFKACPPEPVKLPTKPKTPQERTANSESEQIAELSDIAPYFYNKINNGTDWAKIGFAFASLGEAGRLPFVDVSSNQSNYPQDTPESLSRDFDRFLKRYDGKVKIESLFHYAKEYGYKKARSSEDRACESSLNLADYLDLELVKYSENLPEYQDVKQESADITTVKEYLTGILKKATDHDIAKALHQFNDGNFIYNHTKGVWYNWTGTHWKSDTIGAVRQSILYLSKELLKQAANANERDLQDRLLDARKNLENAKNWTGYLTVYSTISGSEDSRFDQNLNLFNLNNGTYDLSKMLFRSHKKTDYLTDCLSYDYDQTATCERFLQFLDDAFAGNQNLISFLQRSIGYTLTGLTTEQHFFFLHGNGSNGKSVFIEIIMALLGSYCVKIPIDALMQSNNANDKAREMVRMQGKRLVVSNETEEGRRFAESTIKDLTGGDTLTGRKLHEATVEFKPTHKLLIYGNHKPIIRGTDNGIWRRPLLVPFLQTVPEHKKDKFLISRLLKELPGIFNWALAGLRDWKAKGLRPPEEVTLSTAEYKSAMDLVGNFLNECTEPMTNISTSQKELYAAFQQWQRDSGDNSRITSRGLTLKLQERSLPSYKGAGNVIQWENLQIIG